MNSGEKFIFLKEDYDAMIEELERLETDYRRWGKVSTEDGGVGDWHDNPAYEEGMRQMNMLSGRIQEIKLIQDNTEIVKLNEINRKKDKISISSKVIIESDSGEEKKYYIGSYRIFRKKEYESGYMVISYSSPIGRALLGRETDDEINVVIGGDKKTFVVLEVL